MPQESLIDKDPPPMSSQSNKKNLNIQLDEVSQLIELLKSSGINEIEITQGEISIRLRKDSESHHVNLPASAQNVQLSSVASAPQDVAANTESEKINGSVMKSPMVGTFYKSPAPEASPYVQIGDKVKKGQTICIIEAMKTMNQVEAEYDGTLQDILVQDAQPVEFGEPLFVIQ